MKLRYKAEFDDTYDGWCARRTRDGGLIYHNEESFYWVGSITKRQFYAIGGVEVWIARSV